MSKWNQVYQAMHRLFVFMALLCSVFVFLVIFINFREIAQQADGSYPRSTNIVAWILTVTYFYWALRGLVYWLSLHKKGARQ